MPAGFANHTCGNRKSGYEHYLATVLPFGGMHEDAHRSLDTMVAPRLNKNQKLRRELWERFERDGPDSSAALPFDTMAMRLLFQMVPIGLLWHHGRGYLPHSYGSIAFTPPDESLHILAQAFLAMGGDRIEGDLGNGTFRYLALASREDPCLAIWFFQIMGGLKLTGDPASPDSTTSAVVAITGPRSSVEIARSQWL